MLVRLVSNSWPCDLPTLASQSAGITGVSHHIWSIKYLPRVLQTFWICMPISLLRLRKFSCQYPQTCFPSCLLAAGCQWIIGLVSLHNLVFLRGFAHEKFFFSFVWVDLKNWSLSSAILSSGWFILLLILLIVMWTSYSEFFSSRR